MRTLLMSLCIFSVVGCLSVAHTIGLGESPRLELQYFDPGTRISAPVNAATVTVQDPADSRNLDVALKIVAPSDSAVIVILEDGFLLKRLQPLVDTAAISQIALSQRQPSSGIALPVVQVSAENNWVALPRLKTGVLFNGVSVVDAGFCLVAPTDHATLRFRQLVYQTPATKHGRYRLRVNWISFPPEPGTAVTTHCEPGRPALPLSRAPRSAVANDLEAYGQRVDLNWLGVIVFGILALLGVAQIAGS